MDAELLRAACPDLLPGAALYWFDALPSTNDAARERLPETGEAFVLAGRQTAGRGRLGRHFDSGPGGLYVSCAFPVESLQRALTLPAFAALVVAEAVERCLPCTVAIKWPNDLLLQGKKVCGILTEGVASPRPGVILGIGLNVSNDLPASLPEAGSLCALTGVPLPLETLIGALLPRLQALVRGQAGPAPALLERYRARCATLGRTVTVTQGSRSFSGLALDIDGEGALLVQTGAGTERVLSGEATLRGIHN